MKIIIVSLGLVLGLLMANAAYAGDYIVQEFKMGNQRCYNVMGSTATDNHMVCVQN